MEEYKKNHIKIRSLYKVYLTDSLKNQSMTDKFQLPGHYEAEKCYCND